MGNITGANSKLLAGISAWNATPTVNTNINFTSESLTFNVNRTDEGNLLAKKAALPADVTSMNTSGSVSTILRPSMIDWLMKAIMNKDGVQKDAPQAMSNPPYEHYMEYTLCNADVTGGPRHSTLELSRGGQMRKYEDVVLTNLTVTATAQDYVRADFDVTGGNETKITSMTGVAAVDEKSYKCTMARLYAGAPGTIGEDGVVTTASYGWITTCPNPNTVATDGRPLAFDVSETTVTIDPGMVETPALYCSGMFPSQPSIGQRAITINFTLPYSEDIETFYQNYYRDENAPQLSLDLVFTAPLISGGVPVQEAIDVIEITLPNVQINSYSGNVDGVDLINATIGGTAMSPRNGSGDSDNPIIVRHWESYNII